MKQSITERITIGSQDTQTYWEGSCFCDKLLISQCPLLLKTMKKIEDMNSQFFDHFQSLFTSFSIQLIFYLPRGSMNAQDFCSLSTERNHECSRLCSLSIERILECSRPCSLSTERSHECSRPCRNLLRKRYREQADFSRKRVKDCFKATSLKKQSANIWNMTWQKAILGCFYNLQSSLIPTELKDFTSQTAILSGASSTLLLFALFAESKADCSLQPN